MDLSTTYLGLRLPHPFMPGASPLVDDLDTVRRLEDAGAAAIVMHSLFEEQIVHEAALVARYLAVPDAAAFAAALPALTDFDSFTLGPEEYLAHIHKLKAVVAIPVIASLNGTSEGDWLSYARLLERAGADALELNVYAVAADVEDRSEDLESRILRMLRTVKRAVGIPVAFKLSPFYTALAGFAARLAERGADGLVPFNRFYQPDVDVETCAAVPALRLSDPAELRLRLRWLAILAGRTGASLAVSGGVHSSLDAVKALMAGADAVQLVSTLLRHGPEQLTNLRRDLALWLEEHGHDSLAAIKGRVSLDGAADPAAHERAGYVKTLQSWWT